MSNDDVSRQARLPACGASEPRRFLYGEPAFPVAPDVEVGGCIVSDNSPQWHCAACGHEWGRFAWPTPPTDVRRPR